MHRRPGDVMPAPTLVIGTEARIAVSIARSLSRHGVPVDVVSPRPGGRAPRSRWIRRELAFDTSDPAPDKRATALVRAIEHEGYDHLVVTSDSGLRLIDLCREALPENIRRSVPNAEVTATVLDKAASTRLASDSGLDVPAAWTLPNPATLATREPELRFPLVGKPADKRVSEPFKVRYFQDLQSLRASFEGDPDFGHNILFQEFVPGEGVGVEVLMHEGAAVCAFQHRRLRELPWAGGISVVAESEAVDPELLEQATRLLRALGAEGLCMVEYRRDRRSGRCVFMEINARAIGSMSLSERCGVEFSWYHWQLLHDQDPDIPRHYPAGFRWRWTAGVLLRLDTLGEPGPPWESRPSRVRESLGALGDLLPPTRDALWTWTDPLPATAETTGVTAGIAKRRVKGLVRRLLPASFFRRLQTYRHQSPAVRSWRRRRWFVRLFGGLRARYRVAPERVNSILIVCHGNIFRSPMFEHLLRRTLEQAGDQERRVISAGLHARDGGDAHPDAIKTATEFGIDLGAHRAQAITPELIDASDLVIAMDFVNEAELLARHPAAEGRILVIGDLARGEGDLSVADPYGRGLDTVRRCYADLANRAAALGDWLAHRPMASRDSTNPDPVEGITGDADRR